MEHQDPRAMTAETVGRDLLSALVTEIKLLQKPWDALTEAKQNDLIERLRARVESNVKMAVHLIASDGRTVVQGDLDQVTIKDGAKVVIKIGRAAESLHELYDSQGKAVLIVVADGQRHTGGMGEVRGESDQRAMNLGREYTDEDGDGMDDNVVDAEIREVPRLGNEPTQEQLNKARQDGYDAAAEGKDQSECPVMDGRLCIEWVRGWKAWHDERDGVDGDADPDPTDGEEE
ncbi:cell division protein FtsK [Achromobacter aloeverae]